MRSTQTLPRRPAQAGPSVTWRRPLSHGMRASAASMPPLARVARCCGIDHVGLSSGCSRAHTVGLRTRGATARTRCLRLRLRASGRLRWRLGCRLSASLRRSKVLLGLLTRFVSIRHVGQGRPGLPEAHEPSAGQQRAGTGIRAGHSQRGSRRSGAARKQQDQRGRAGSRSERSEQGACAHHGDSGAGLACPSGQFAPRSIHLLAS